MATKSAGFYDSPNCTVRREVPGTILAAASGTTGPVIMYQKFKLKAVNGVITTQGGTTMGFTVRNGTNSVGSVTIGTATGTFTSGALDLIFNSLDQLNLLKSADATGAALVSFEIEVTPDAVCTA